MKAVPANVVPLMSCDEEKNRVIVRLSETVERRLSRDYREDYREEKNAHLENSGDKLSQAAIEKRVAEDRGKERPFTPLGQDEHQHACRHPKR